MELVNGRVAVVTGAASGIGLALAERFARSGLSLVLADIEKAALDDAARRIGATGVDVLAVPTDVSDEDSVQALASAAVQRFGAVHLVCNNAGVTSSTDPWFGPTSVWRWVLGVNLWGVIHGVRAFLPILAGQDAAHIVNTSSMAGLMPGFSPPYDASKHAVVALSEDLYHLMRQTGLPIGVSVLCPGWVRTQILDADRNWPERLGSAPERSMLSEFVQPHVRRAIDEGAQPAAVADLVAEAVEADRFWVIPHPEFLEIAVQRWHSIAEGSNPSMEVDMPGLPPAAELLAQVQALLTPPAAPA
jgi:NAD(P)-dependent dehydrogenase (short-subunit alcohol dehydrogenase family)